VEREARTWILVRMKEVGKTDLGVVLIHTVVSSFTTRSRFSETSVGGITTAV
jgi:hypothetical protein